MSKPWNTKRVLAKLLLCSLLLLGACANREQMSDDYGHKSRVFFAKQHAFAQASSGAPEGLDSEESALIQANYRKSLAGSEAPPDKNSSSRVLLLQEPGHGNAPR